MARSSDAQRSRPPNGRVEARLLTQASRLRPRERAAGLPLGLRQRRGRSPVQASPSSPSHPHLPSSSPPNQEASGSVGEEITTPAVALRKISAAAAAAAAPLVAGDGSEGSGEPRKIAEEPKARARRGEPVGL